MTRFDNTKSTMRCLPLNGTAGLQRLAVRGCRREPSPPAMTKARTFLVAGMDNSRKGGCDVERFIGDKHCRQRRQREFERRALPVQGRLRRVRAAEVAHAAAAVY